MLQRYLLIWLILSSAAAFCWPAFGFSVDPFLLTGGNGIQHLLSVIMLSIGLLLPVQEVDALVRRWPLVLGGTAVQYTCMPFLAWMAVMVFRPDAETAAGILIVGCVPGAMASNVLTLTARGNVSYSVSLTTLATLLSPLVVPAVLGLTMSSAVSYDGRAAVRMLVFRVVVPVVVGHLVRRSGRVEWIVPAARTVASLAILIVIAVAVALRREQLRDPDFLLVTELVLVNGAGFLSGWFGGRLLRLPPPMQRALTLEVGMQNAGAGTALAVELFGADSAAITPCILYTFGCMLSGTLLATFWNARPLPE